MAEIIKQREKKTDVSYELCFYEKATNEVVWGFPLLNGKGTEPVPCTQGKEVSVCKEEECTWWNNYIKAKADETLYSEEDKIEWSWTEPAVAICECGKEITLDYDAQECEHCGRLHNLFGQELLPRHMWEEDYWGEDY